MDKENKKSALVPILVLIIVALTVLCVLLATETISFKKTNNNNCIKEANEINTNQKTKEKSFDSKIINLKDENESFDFGKLHLDFKGVSVEEGDDFYNYTLAIKMNDKDVDSSFFNDEYKTHSSNMAANFKLYKIENVYVLISFIAKQCFCDEVMIINNDGKILKTFTNSTFEYEEDNQIKISTSDNGACMGDDYEKHQTHYNYTVVDDTINLN